MCYDGSRRAVAEAFSPPMTSRLLPQLIGAQAEPGVPVTRELWHGLWTFLLALAFLTSEWSLRRAWGDAVRTSTPMERLLGTVMVLLLLAPGQARAEDYYALVVTGAPGDATYADTYTGWRQGLVDVLRARPGFRDDHLVVLGGTPGPGVGAASKEGVAQAFADLRQRMTTGSVLLVLLMGHGTYDGVVAKFNLVGPDLDAESWDRLLDDLPGQTVFVNTTASSLSICCGAGAGRAGGDYGHGFVGATL